MQFNSTTTVQKPYTLRYEGYEGKRYIVVPVVMMKEGVHSGSAGAVYHSAAELSHFPEAWNGIPVMVNHPAGPAGEPVSANSSPSVLSGKVGIIFNTFFENAGLHAEAWLDEAVLQSVAPEVLTYLAEGRPIEVSMGAFSDDEPATGQWNGESYAAISHNYRPDHLALLPHASGACGWAGGCGVRTNAEQLETQGVDDVGDRMNKSLFLGMQMAGYQLRPLPDNPLQTNAGALGYRALTRSIQQQLDTMDNEEVHHYLEEVYGKDFIYSVERRNRPSSLYRRGYTSAGAGATVTFADAIEEVVKEVSYVKAQPITNNQDTGIVRTTPPKGAQKMGTNVNCGCPDKLDALIKTNGFAETDREWLSALPNEHLDRLIAVNTVVEAKEPAKVTEKPVVTEPVVNAATPPMTEEQVLAALSPAMRSQFEYGLKVHKDHRDGLIATITANTKVYTADELGNQSDDQLEKIAQLVQPRDYSVNGMGGIGVNARQTGEAPLLPIGVVAE